MYRSPNAYETADCATATYIKKPRNYIEVNNIEYDLDKKQWSMQELENYPVGTA